MNVLYDFKVDKRYILGLLNSKLMSYFTRKNTLLHICKVVLLALIL